MLKLKVQHFGRLTGRVDSLEKTLMLGGIGGRRRRGRQKRWLDGITNSGSLLKLMSMSQCCHPTISSSVVHFSSHLQSFPASGSFQMSHFFTSGGQSFGVSPPASVLISFRMDWLVLLAVQGTLKSLLQYHRSKASILWCSAFFIVQLSHPYITTGK